jgi:DNA-binding beta-propeller fold protein YncE
MSFVQGIKAAWLAFALFAAGSSLQPAAGLAAASFESGQVRPLALSPDGSRLFAVNTPAGRLEIFDLTAGDPLRLESVPVGLEPVAVAARGNGEVWVVNHLSDSVSIVDLNGPPRVVRTLLVGDEPRDIVFAGPDKRRAFITTAHRGQNIPFDPQLRTPSIGRADVWVFDAENLGSTLGGEPLEILHLFADTPRALASSPDGSLVYAAAFRSGNRTTVVSPYAVCLPEDGPGPCTIAERTMPGPKPPPNANFEGIEEPRTGLIVRYDADAEAWQDELGRDWGEAIDISLPDNDVFVIDAHADPPRMLRSLSNAGTVLYNLAVNPVSGDVYVSNTEANNELRFEPNVRGRIHESRISIIQDDVLIVRNLNKHIDYDVVPSPPGVRQASLALPLGMEVGGDGETLYLAAFGSSAVGVFDIEELENDSFVPSAEAHIRVSGGGPSGLALDEVRNRLYVLTRFDNGLSVVDLDARQEVHHVVMPNPEPAAIVAGRPFLYDSTFGGSNGEAVCGSCHVFGDNDALAWDLGNPNGVVVTNPNPLNELFIDAPLRPFVIDFHPMKGPMTTQTLRGMAGNGPMHWRGDRTGGLLPDGDPMDERAAFRQFNPAFVTLLGREQSLTPEQMEAFADFALAISPPPNPNRRLDGTLTPEQEAARADFFNPVRSDGDPPCFACHTVAPESGLFGTSRTSTVNGFTSQFMKVASLRTVYDRIGMFGLFGEIENFPPGRSRDQVRGYGMMHDGSVGPLRDDLGEFILIFDTNFAPIVGQQTTLAHNLFDVAGARVDLLAARAALGECDLVVRGVVGGEPQGWLRTAASTFRPNRENGPVVSDAELRELARTPGNELTYTCVPPGDGTLRAIDADSDGHLDGDERDASSDPYDPASTPVPECAGDCSGDQQVSVDELVVAINIALGDASIESCHAADVSRDGILTVDEIIGAVDRALRGCAA